MSGKKQAEESQVLRGWDAIGQYLGRSGRSIRTWVDRGSEIGKYIRRDKTTRWVFALKPELDRYLLEQETLSET